MKFVAAVDVTTQAAVCGPAVKPPEADALRVTVVPPAPPAGVYVKTCAVYVVKTSDVIVEPPEFLNVPPAPPSVSAIVVDPDGVPFGVIV